MWLMFLFACGAGFSPKNGDLSMTELTSDELCDLETDRIRYEDRALSLEETCGAQAVAIAYSTAEYEGGDYTTTCEAQLQSCLDLVAGTNTGALGRAVFDACPDAIGASMSVRETCASTVDAFAVCVEERMEGTKALAEHGCDTPPTLEQVGKTSQECLEVLTFCTPLLEVPL